MTTDDSGWMRWGVKESFRAYVAQAEDGRAEASAGAQLDEDGLARFTFVEVEWEDDLPRVLRFAGSLSYSAHDNLLSLRIRDPWLEIETDGAATLTVLHPAIKGPTDTRLRIGRIHEFAVERDSDLLSAQQLPVALTMDGTGTFEYRYLPESLLDPVSFRIPIHGARIPE